MHLGIGEDPKAGVGEEPWWRAHPEGCGHLGIGAAGGHSRAWGAGSAWKGPAPARGGKA